MGAAPLPRELQFFGSSTVRKSALDPTRSHAAPTYMRTPGWVRWLLLEQENGVVGVDGGPRLVSNTRVFRPGVT